MNDRLFGLLLFLPVPLVLVLYTRQPIGPTYSLVLGTVLMLTHALYARPFALRRAQRRCLWCGIRLRGEESRELTVIEPRGQTTWRACTAHHRARLKSTLAYASRYAHLLRLGILGGLLVFLGLTVLISRGLVPGTTNRDAVAFFQVAVAVSVLPLGWFGPHFRTTGHEFNHDAPREALRVPFPLHLQALIGTLSVIWLFRLIGLYWLVAGIGHFLRGSS